MVARILLLLLGALSLSQCTELKIDWDQCGTNTYCFIRKSCIEQNTEDSVLVQFSGGRLKNNDCDAALVIRVFKHTKYLVTMKLDLSSDTANTISDSGISLKQEIDQLSCTKNGPSGNTALFNIDKQGDHKFENNIAFCTFFIESVDGQPINYKFNGKPKPSLEFTIGTTPKSITYRDAGDILWISLISKCNPEMLTTTISSGSEFVEDTIDTLAYPPFSCVSPKSIIVTRENESPLFLKKDVKLECFESKWTYRDDTGPIPVPVNEKLNVVCGVRFCTLCTDFQPEDRSNCPFGCDTINPIPTDVAGSEGCKQYTCPNNEWKVNEGERHSVNAPIECKQQRSSMTYRRNSVWYLKPEKANPIEVTKASCLDTTVCWNKKQFNEGCPEGVKTGDCKNVNRTAHLEELFCPDGLSLLVTSGDKLSSAELPRLKCDYYAGLYRALNGPLLQNNRENSFVGCAPSYSDATSTRPSAAGVTSIHSGLFFLAVLLLKATGDAL